MRPSLTTLLFSTLALSLSADFPIEDSPPIEDNLYESQDTLHKIPWGGDSSFTDDVDLDGPEVTPPEFQPSPRPPPKPAAGVPEELVIDLKNPTFSQGVIRTEEGGVITGPSMRIQARKIAYTNKTEQGVPIQTLTAEEDLMLEHGGRAFVGSKLDYDFIKKRGVLYNGKTFVDIWFLGGDRIELREDGSFYITGAFITTCEEQENTWDINAEKMSISQDKLLSAKNIQFRFLKIPFFWLPAFKSNLKAFSDTPVRYKVIWDKGLGPRVTMRYRFFSWNDLNLFFRLDYRLSRGFGAAFESEYFAKDQLTTFVTRSYGAHDKTFPDQNGSSRYRLQGLYHRDSKDGMTQAHLTWDKLSDPRMIGDFRSEDFEINTEKRTRFFFAHQFDHALVRFNVEPRANRFDSIDQQLPLLFSSAKPFEIGSSGILSTNRLSAGYLNYVFANDQREAFHRVGLKSSTRSARMETSNTLHRPFSINALTVTPYAGFSGIFYSNSPESKRAGQAIATYGFTAQAPFYKRYTSVLHLTEPYLSFEGLTSPTTAISNHFYFDIHDGLDKLNQMRIGWRNALFPFKTHRFFPSLSTDLYAYAFFGGRAFQQTIPRIYFDLDWTRPSYRIYGGVAWRVPNKLWEYTNVAADITINEHVAFGFEMRHRSRFEWRKADQRNYIIDVAQPPDELLKSPLSDGRNTLLGKCFLRLSPKWSLQFQSKTGWGRKKEPSYNALRVDLVTLLTCSWKWRVTYERMPNDDRFSSSISLVK